MCRINFCNVSFAYGCVILSVGECLCVCDIYFCSFFHQSMSYESFSETTSHMLRSLFHHHLFLYVDEFKSVSWLISWNSWYDCPNPVYNRGHARVHSRSSRPCTSKTETDNSNLGPHPSDTTLQRPTTVSLKARKLQSLMFVGWL